MSDALSIAADLGFAVSPPPSQVTSISFIPSIAADLGFSVSPPPFLPSLNARYSLLHIHSLDFTVKSSSNGTSIGSGEKSDELVRVLKELTAVQRKIADLQVELQGRKLPPSQSFIPLVSTHPVHTIPLSSPLSVSFMFFVA
ncbi:unnamed protein product [Cuscuta campestris]|uniref:Uncharacterized protein n=1 Tax=Cuscuta campestris TaxID=132261 RepID=A0A484LSF1_9ASTE|nr:unnamed protein product [Cuscuta campestris]